MTVNNKVSFTQMIDGTREDYDLVFAHEEQSIKQQAGKVITWLQMMSGDSPYRISRLDHCLQTATRAETEGASDEMIACALLHDIGDVLAPANHSEVAAALLRPYVSDQSYQIVRHHGLFQGYYWMHHFDQDPRVRDRYSDQPWYEACVEFCARWDQASFDPHYRTHSLEHFIPLIEWLFARPRSEYV